MHEFTVEKTLDVTKDKLWAVVADFANLDWYQGAARVEREGEGIGQVRRIFMPGMDQPVEEQLLALDSNNCTLEYTVLEGAVNIMRDYHVIARLQDADGGGTRASWQARFSGVSVDGVAPADMIAVMQSTYDGMLDAMAAAARSR